jgi:sec-independent protein translocase protein TatA
MLEGLLQPLHLLVILAIALLVFGPARLPELGKGLGEALRGFRTGLKGESSSPALDAHFLPAPGGEASGEQGGLRGIVHEQTAPHRDHPSAEHA